jgi:hypothetical protein
MLSPGSEGWRARLLFQRSGSSFHREVNPSIHGRGSTFASMGAAGSACEIARSGERVACTFYQLTRGAV